MMKKLLLISLLMLTSGVKGLFSQSAIEKNFNSSNGWMPNQIGDITAPLSSPGPGCYDAFAYTTNPNGFIYGIANNTSFIESASTHFARYGGATQDINFYTTAQLVPE